MLLVVVDVVDGVMEVEVEVVGGIDVDVVLVVELIVVNPEVCNVVTVDGANWSATLSVLK